jgi:hypothetical protein
MALKDTIKNMKDLLCQISCDIEKSDGGNKAASQRVRTGTVKLEKIAKRYRKESIQSEKSSRGGRKPAGGRKAAPKKAVRRPEPIKPKLLKAKLKAKAHRAKPRALSFKKPTAKLLTRRTYR